jgi:hypothetical protein
VVAKGKGLVEEGREGEGRRDERLGTESALETDLVRTGFIDDLHERGKGRREGGIST